MWIIHIIKMLQKERLLFFWIEVNASEHISQSRWLCGTDIMSVSNSNVNCKRLSSWLSLSFSTERSLTSKMQIKLYGLSLILKCIQNFLWEMYLLVFLSQICVVLIKIFRMSIIITHTVRKGLWAIHFWTADVTPRPALSPPHAMCLSVLHWV